LGTARDGTVDRLLDQRGGFGGGQVEQLARAVPEGEDLAVGRVAGPGRDPAGADEERRTGVRGTAPAQPVEEPPYLPARPAQASIEALVAGVVGGVDEERPPRLAGSWRRRRVVRRRRPTGDGRAVREEGPEACAVAGVEQRQHPV